MKVNLTYDSSTVNATALGSPANLSAFEAQVNAAAQLFNTTFFDPVTVNITVKYASGGLGSSRQNLYSYSLGTVKDALKKDITSLDDLKTANALATSGTVYLTHAQLKALGLIAESDPGSDGTITFDNTPGLIDFTHSSKMSSSSYDLFGVAAHEISEIMGRMVDPTLGGGAIAPTVLTQFNTAGNFTIGSETLLKFNTAPTGDRGDWDSSVAASDAFRAFANPGVVSTISATDLRAVDVVGWDHRALDLVFAIDTTGSMSPYIDNVKTNALSIVNTAFGTAAAPIDARIAIVGFKDAAGPNGPGDNTAILKFTEQDTYDARKTTTINAINSISVSGGGDIPEGDNSALLYALQGNLGDWRRAAQDHKIILFTDAPIKDTGLASQVVAAAAKLGVTVTASTVTSGAGFTAGDFTFTAPATSVLALDSLASVMPGDDAGDIDEVFVGPTPGLITFSSQVYAIQVGTDTTATAGLTALAKDTGGTFFTGNATNLSDIIQTIIAPPTFSIAETSASRSEGNTGSTAFTFTVTRAGATTATGGVNWAVTASGANPVDAADFVNGVLPSGTVNFAAGDTTAQVITVNVSGDTVVEANEDFTVTLSGATGATVAIGSATGMIINDDTEDDVVFSTKLDDVFHLGAGTDTVVFSAPRDQYRIGMAGEWARVSGPDGLDDLKDVELLQFGASAPITAKSLRSQPGTEELMSFIIEGQLSFQLPIPYSGPLDLRYVYPGTNLDDIVAGTSSNDFMNLSGGNDAVHMGPGDDIVDGGGGSNFLSGDGGRDIFFLDGRFLVPVWSCITDWEAGEQLALWGWKPGVSEAAWSESGGLPGWKGVTMFADIDGNGLVETAITWTGRSFADLPAVHDSDGLRWFY